MAEDDARRRDRLSRRLPVLRTPAAALAPIAALARFAAEAQPRTGYSDSDPRDPAGCGRGSR